jgi:aspartyl-tRNA(Asn)/glutamyl-tRNA(Gln) amidotransferase subunit A
MSYLDLSIREIHEALLNKKVSILDLTKEAISRAKKDTNNAFECILEKEALEKATKLNDTIIPKDNYFYGIPYVAKDNFSTKDIETTGGSNILVGYMPLFDATVIKYLNEAGAILIGKTTLDELAMGGTGTSGHKGKTFNPYDPSHTHMIGGSSCGSAAAVADGIVPFALGSDTGDSVRKPASNSALVGMKPTWGLISRYGLFPFAPSLDHVAYFTRNVEDSALLLNLLSKHDDNDETNSFKTRDDYFKELNSNVKGKKIAVIKEIRESITDKEMNKKFNESLEFLKNEGAIVEEVSMNKDLLTSIFPTYFVISCAEATSNNANLDGIKFGPNYGGKTYQDVMYNARTKGFSGLIKRRFVIGSYSLMSENQHDLFLRAQKARHLIVDAFNEVFKKYDCIYLLAAPNVAPKFDEASDRLNNEYLIADNYLAFGNFGGYPSMTIPLGFKNGLPYGANITSKPYDEKSVFNLALNLEKFTHLADVSFLNYKDKEEK